VKPASTPWRLVHKKTWRDSLLTDTLLSAVSVLVVARPSSLSSGGTYELSCINNVLHTVGNQTDNPNAQNSLLHGII